MSTYEEMLHDFDEWDDEHHGWSDPGCSHCCGEGQVEGDTPGWDDGDIVPCYACHGTGNRRDQTVF
jgi:hypothetical protein